jgi:hypothetical protein
MSTRTACVTLCPAKRYSRESVPAPAPAVAILSCRIRFLQGPFQIGYWSIQFRALASDGDDSICIAAASQDEIAEYDLPFCSGSSRTTMMANMSEPMFLTFNEVIERYRGQIGEGIPC